MNVLKLALGERDKLDPKSAPGKEKVFTSNFQLLSLNTFV